MTAPISSSLLLRYHLLKGLSNMNVTSLHTELIDFEDYSFAVGLLDKNKEHWRHAIRISANSEAIHLVRALHDLAHCIERKIEQEKL